MTAKFSFTSEKFSVEFRGTEEFVTEQIGLVKGRIIAVLRGGEESAESGGAGPEREQGRGESSLEEFYREAKTREGRGALQDSILIFAHYMHSHQEVEAEVQILDGELDVPIEDEIGEEIGR